MGTREELLALLTGEMEAGDSDGEVAKRLGVQKQTLWSWMQGKGVGSESVWAALDSMDAHIYKGGEISEGSDMAVLKDMLQRKDSELVAERAKSKALEGQVERILDKFFDKMKSLESKPEKDAG